MVDGVDLSLSLSEDEYDEKCVSVLLEGEEAELVFIDHPSSEISVSCMDEN